MARTESEVMGFASTAFKKPWAQTVDVFRRLRRGEKVEASEAKVDYFFMPVPLDARLSYQLMRKGLLRLFMGGEPTLFTLVLSRDRSRLVWAGLETCEEGIYTQIHELKDRLGEEWAKRALHFVKKENYAGCYAFLKNWVRQQPGLESVKLGAVKVADLNFFERFLEAFEAGKGKDFLSQQRLYARALFQILRHREVVFYPAVPMYRLIQVGQGLTRILPMRATLPPARQARVATPTAD